MTEPATTAAHLPNEPATAISEFLLCPPRYFGVEYSINPFMDLEVEVDRDAAWREWSAFRDAILAAGARVVEQQPVDHLPDLVFTNNAAFVLDGQAVLSRFRFAERQGEARYDRAALKSLGIIVHELPPRIAAFEGAADAMPFAGKLVCGHGYRTDRAVIPELAAFTERDVVEVELTVDPRYYHLDLAFCPLDDEGQRALINPFAMTRASLARLLELVPHPILLTEEEALGFCANSVPVGSRLLMPTVTERLTAELAAVGVEAVHVPVAEFHKAGGALACMALRLDRS